MNENLINLLSKQKIFPIIRSSDPEKIVDIADAIIKGGLNIFEINIESIDVYRAIVELSDRAVICAGGVITSMQAQAALLSGAKFISSPVFHMSLVKLSKDLKVPYVAGTSTANEAYQAWKSRIELVKLYPVTALGGPLYVEDLLRPMPFLNLMVQGNIKLSEVKSYIDVGASVVGIGRDISEGYSYSDITARIQETISKL